MEYLKPIQQGVKNFIQDPKTSLNTLATIISSNSTVQHVYLKSKFWASKIPLEPLIILALVLPLLMSFRMGKNSSNRAKYFSKKLKKYNKSINKIHYRSLLIKKFEKITSVLKKFIEYGNISGLFYLIMDYFMLDGITLSKLIENFTLFYILCFGMFQGALWYALKRFSQYLLTKRTEVSKNMRTE